MKSRELIRSGVTQSGFMSLFQSILTSADAVNCKFSRKCELIRKSTAGYQSHFDKLWDGGSNTQYSFNLEHHWRYFYLVRFSFWPCLHGKPWNFTGQTNRDTTASGTTESKNYDPSPWIQTVESLEMTEESLMRHFRLHRPIRRLKLNIKPDI